MLNQLKKNETKTIENETKKKQMRNSWYVTGYFRC